jgi:predicted nicotinamide N-methyase
MSIHDLGLRLNRTLPTGRIEPIRLPETGGVTLALINCDFPTGPLEAETMAAVIRQPAYWAFCWGSGLALARHFRSEDGLALVRARRVLDFGSGSGIAGIAAARAGAARVAACDSDADARAATRVNAHLNGVALEVLDDPARLDFRPDLVVMADVLYDRANLPLLSTVQALADEVLVADSRMTTLPEPGYHPIGALEARTVPNLGEFDEFRIVQLFHWRRGQH